MLFLFFRIEIIRILLLDVPDMTSTTRSLPEKLRLIVPRTAFRFFPREICAAFDPVDLSTTQLLTLRILKFLSAM
jgi:hypothetical protein